jgi:hypothetical protein
MMVAYFECADPDLATFYQVCALLRGVARNPERNFVHKGPTWHGRRVATWQDLFTGRGPRELSTAARGGKRGTHDEWRT